MTATYRLDIYRNGTATPEQLTLPSTEEHKADDVARAIRDAGADVVDVYEMRNGVSYLTGWFRAQSEAVR